MSALLATTDYTVVDPGHSLIRLAQRVQPHLSHLVYYPKRQVVIDTDDRRQFAICMPLTRTFLITTKGLAYIVRPFGLFRTTPRLMSHVSIALIEPQQRTMVARGLQDLLDQQKRIFG
jgi:hypothetical protein